MSAICSSSEIKKPFSLLMIGLVVLALSSRSIAQPHPGTIDLSFNSEIRATSNWIGIPALDAQGNVLLVGQFSFSSGLTRDGIARLHSDGSLDHSFHPTEQFAGQVETLLPSNDGQLLVGGTFTGFGSSKQTYVLRLNDDGGLDQNFVSALLPSVNPYAGVRAIRQESDGRILVAGAFFAPRFGDAGLARLNSDGLLDAGFQPLPVTAWAGFFQSVNSLAILPDQRIIYAGYFDPWIVTPGGLGRLDQNGNRDAVFKSLAPLFTSGSLLIQSGESDLRLLVGVGGLGIPPFVRLSIDGVLDQDFRIPDQVRYPYAVQSNGKILVRWNNGIARLNPDGDLDTSFEPTDQPEDPPRSSFPGLTSAILQPDGKVLAVGQFDTFRESRAPSSSDSMVEALRRNLRSYWFILKTSGRSLV